jgi:tetratricopeptide (TPR) repeat protein
VNYVEFKAQYASLYGDLFARLGQFAVALPYLDKAMNHSKEVESVSLRSALSVKTLGRMADCYHCMYDALEWACCWATMLTFLSARGRDDTAERMFNYAIRTYEKCQGHFALSTPSQADASALADLDDAIVAVLLHYAMLLTSLNRQKEVEAIRQRALRLVRNSSALRRRERRIMDGFDDSMKLFSIREERRRKRIDGLIPALAHRLARSAPAPPMRLAQEVKSADEQADQSR